MIYAIIILGFTTAMLFVSILIIRHDIDEINRRRREEIISINKTYRELRDDLMNCITDIRKDSDYLKKQDLIYVLPYFKLSDRYLLKDNDPILNTSLVVVGNPIFNICDLTGIVTLYYMTKDINTKKLRKYLYKDLIRLSEEATK